MAVDNYYEILGIDPSADEDTIRGAIRKTRGRYRQVAGSPNKEQARNAEVMIEKLAEAEKQLLDPEVRKGYDAQLSAQPAPSLQPAPTSGGSTSWIETAKSYLANGQPRNAAQAAKEATRAEPDSVDAWTVRAYAALELRDFQDADFSANEAQKRDPGNPQMFGLIADVADGEGRYADAQRAFSRAAELEPTNPYWSGRVAWAMSDQGQSKQAVDKAYQVSAQFPDSDYAKSTYAMMLLKDAEAALSRDRDGIYFTNKKQIAYVEERLDVVQQLASPSENVVNFYNETRQFVANAKKRRFIWPGVGTFVKYGVIWLILMCSGGVLEGFAGTVVFLGGTALLGWLLLNKVLPVQWAVNKRALGSAAKTGLQ